MFIINKAGRDDIPAVLEIEKVSHARPWNEAGFICELSKQRSGRGIFLTAQDEGSGAIAGYITGDFIVDYLHISNMAVGPDFRRGGAGRMLLAAAERETLKKKFSSLTLEVSEKNEAALSLYRRFGFEIKGRRPKFYEEKYDGLLMWKRLI